MEEESKAVSLFEEERIWRTDVRAYSKALLSHWIGALSGGVVAFVIAIVSLLGLHMPSWIGILWGFAFAIVVASFLVFQEQRRAAELAEKRLLRIEQENAQLKAEALSKEERKKNCDVLAGSLSELSDRRNHLQRMSPSKYNHENESAANYELIKKIFHLLAEIVGQHAAEQFRSASHDAPPNRNEQQKQAVERLSAKVRRLDKIIDDYKGLR